MYANLWKLIAHLDTGTVLVVRTMHNGHTASYGRHRAAQGSGLSYLDPFVPEVCLLRVDEMKLILKCVKNIK